MPTCDFCKGEGYDPHEDDLVLCPDCCGAGWLMDEDEENEFYDRVDWERELEKDRRMGLL
jgi:DnaJ-class molecular chaperone